MGHEEHVDHAGGPVAPVHQSITLVAQRGRKVSRAEPLMSDVINTGTDQLRQDVRVHVGSWLDQDRQLSESEEQQQVSPRPGPAPSHLQQQVIDARHAVGGADVLLLVPLVEQRATFGLFLLC